MISPDAREFAHSIARYLGAEPAALREIEGLGEVNHVFVADEKWVVRFHRDPLESGDYAAEAWCLRNALLHGIPSPSLVEVGNLNGIAFLVQGFVEGECADAHRSPQLWRTLGRYAGMVNEIALDGSAPDVLFGRFGRDPGAAWTAHLDYNLGRLRQEDPLIEMGVYAPSDQGAIRNCFESLRARVDRFGLTHGDLVPKNVLLSSGTATLIDWGSARIAPIPYQDYLRIASAEASERFSRDDLASFAEGYGFAPDGVLGVAADIELLNRIDVVRWAIEHRPDRLKEVAAQARRVVAHRFG